MYPTWKSEELCAMPGQRVRDPLSLLYPSPSGDCLWQIHLIPTLSTSDVPESFFSCQSRARVTSPSSQSHLKFFRVELESSHKKGRVTWSHWFTSSSQCRVIQNFKLFPYVCGYRSTNGRSVAIGSPVDFQGVADIKSTTSKIKKIGFTTSTEKTKKYWWTSKQAKQQEANMNYILNMNRTSLCSHSNHVLITLLFSLPVTT